MSEMTRRTMLVSGSTALMLPILESDVIAKRSTAAPNNPQRLVFLAMGYGVNQAQWFPKQSGSDYALSPSLASFEDLKSDISIVQGLSNRHKSTAHGGSTTFLNCCNLKNGTTVSCDQVAAEVLGKDTRHSSLVLAGKKWRVDGHGSYASFGQNGKPVGLYRTLDKMYASLFGGGDNGQDVRANLALQKSSLDAIMENAKRLNNHISAADRHRVDEYFTSIRNVEKRIGKAEEWVKRPRPQAPYPSPNGKKGKEEIEIMFDLMRIAMMSDTTRVMSYMLPPQNILKELRSKLNPHRMSHKAKEELHAQRDKMMADLVADFVRSLKETKEADGSSLLDHSLVAYGSVIRSGHQQGNGPLLVAGHGGGGLTQGQNLLYPKKTPLSNLWLSMLRHVGVKTNKFAESNGVLKEMGFK